MRVVVVVFHVHTGITYTYNYINMYSIEYIYVCVYDLMVVCRFYSWITYLVSFVLKFLFSFVKQNLLYANICKCLFEF